MTKIVELILDAENEENGLTAISVVDLPAIESDFIALSKNMSYSLAKVDNEKKLLVGAALIPNKQILRVDENEVPYYVWFSKETVKQAAYKFLKDGIQHQFTLQHEKKVSDLFVAESWIVENETDKAYTYGLNVPIGTWMVAVKVDDDKFWTEFVQTKKVRGFSIEAYFAQRFKGKLVSEIDQLINELENETK